MVTQANAIGVRNANGAVTGVGLHKNCVLSVDVIEVPSSTSCGSETRVPDSEGTWSAGTAGRDLDAD